MPTIKIEEKRNDDGGCREKACPRRTVKTALVHAQGNTRSVRSITGLTYRKEAGPRGRRMARWRWWYSWEGGEGEQGGRDDGEKVVLPGRSGLDARISGCVWLIRSDSKQQGGTEDDRE